MQDTTTKTEFLRKFYDLQKEHGVEIEGGLSVYTKEGFFLGDIEVNYDSVDLINEGITEASYIIPQGSDS
jgi:hypothetical protein